MSNTSPIETKIIEMIFDVTGTPPSQIKATSNLQDDIGMDSLEILDVNNEIEKHFKIAISDEELQKIKTVSHFTQKVISKLNQN